MITIKSFEQKDLLTAQEVSAYLRIPLSSLYELTRKGKIHGIKIGRHWRYLKSELVRHLGASGHLDGFRGERRKYPRLKTFIPVKVTAFFDRTCSCKNEPAQKGIIENLSLKGAFFRIAPALENATSHSEMFQEKFRQTTKVILHMLGDEGFFEHTLEGELVHHIRDIRKESGFGIALKNIPEELERILRAYA